MPDVGIQIPPNLSDWWTELVREGATDLGGLSANGDHISPEHPFPSPHQVRKRLKQEGYALTERLCVYPQYIEPDWIAQGVLDTIKSRYWSFIPRRGSGRRNGVAIDAGLAPGAIERARDGHALSRAELTALFAERRPEVIEDMRLAADELRARLAGDTATFVVNRNINFTNVCQVGCAFCGFGQGRRSPDAYHATEDDFAAKVREAVDFGVTEICMQGGIHPDYTLEHYGRWLRLAKETAPDVHLHAYSPMEVHYMCERSGRSPRDVFEYLRECGLGSTPGTAAEVLHDGVRERISPNKLPVGRWVEIIEASHASGLRSTVTVMFGHIEEPWELAEHMRVVRELQERTGGFTEFVPLSFIPFHTLLGRTHGIEEISREENLKHTAVFRLALGETVTNLQASWVKMGLDAATEALRWGVNDLGGTLMEESISRMAGSQHGVRLDPPQLIEAARRGGRRPAQRDTLYNIVETVLSDACGAMVAARRAAPGEQSRPLRATLSRGRARAGCRGGAGEGAARAACAAPTCTWSRASCRTRSCRSCRATRWWGRWIGLGEGVEEPAVGRARRRAMARGHGRHLPVLPQRAREPLRAPDLHGLPARRRLRGVRDGAGGLRAAAARGLSRSAGGAAAVRRSDRLPRAAVDRDRGARRAAAAGPVRVRGVGSHRRSRSRDTSATTSTCARAASGRSSSRSSWAPDGRAARRSHRRWSSTRRSSSRRPGRSSRRRCARCAAEARSCAPAST